MTTEATSTITVPPWIPIAEKELGVAEVAGAASNKRVLEYLRSCETLPANMQAVDSTAWCSAFCCWCIEQAGLKSTNKANARSWLTWGAPSSFIPGAVVVFSAPDRGEAAGHVGFALYESDKLVCVLGGNQSDRVCAAFYPRDRLLGYRWPTAAEGK